MAVGVLGGAVPCGEAVITAISPGSCSFSSPRDPCPLAVRAPSRGSGTGAGPRPGITAVLLSLGLVHILYEPQGRSAGLLPGCKSRTLAFTKHRELLKPNAVSETDTDETASFPEESCGGGFPRLGRGSLLSARPWPLKPSDPRMEGMARSPPSSFGNSISTFGGLNGDPQRYIHILTPRTYT